MSDRSCPWCSGVCRGADLGPLQADELGWLWRQLAAAGDRRGDPDLTAGTVTVVAPNDPAHRHAAVGLLGGRPLAPGQRRRVDLADLTGRLEVRGPRLTPGAVAAHALGRELAARAKERSLREQVDERLRVALLDWLPTRYVPRDGLWEQLRAGGWVARLRNTDDPDATLARVLAVTARLPETGFACDRRQIADQALDDPHGLDDGLPVPSLTLGLLLGLGVAEPGPRPRDIWGSVGVVYDDLTGGLLAVGVFPTGWDLPAGAVATVPPRELAGCGWPAPPGEDSRVWVTENPSVLAAAADLVTDGVAVRMLCTGGTPSAVEVAAVGRLSAAGWSVVVRADFDAAGLAHVRALLAGVPGATPWRMDAGSYLTCVERSPAAPALVAARLGETAWDPELAVSMAERAVAGFEESLLPELLADVAAPP